MSSSDFWPSLASQKTPCFIKRKVLSINFYKPREEVTVSPSTFDPSRGNAIHVFLDPCIFSPLSIHCRMSFLCPIAAITVSVSSSSNSKLSLYFFTQMPASFVASRNEFNAKSWLARSTSIVSNLVLT